MPTTEGPHHHDSAGSKTMRVTALSRIEQERATTTSRRLRVLRSQSDPDRHHANASDLEQDTRWENFVRPHSPCEISNDPAEEDLLDPLATCNVTKYMCQTPQVFQPYLTIMFEYDIYTAASVPEAQALAYVEERIFRETAEVLGIDDCRMHFNHGQHLRRTLLAELGNSTTIFSLETSPKDEILGTPCKSSFDATEMGPLACLAVLGGFTVFGEEVNDLRHTLQDMVKEKMDDDSFVVDSFIPKVVHVRAIKPPQESSEPTQFPPPPESPPAEDRLADGGAVVPTTADHSSAVAVLVVAAAGLAMIIFLVFYAMTRKRLSRKNETSRSMGAILDDPELLLFDITDNSLSPKGLAIRDSLALVPQHVLSDDLDTMDEESASNFSTTVSPDVVQMSYSDDDVYVEDDDDADDVGDDVVVESEENEPEESEGIEQDTGSRGDYDERLQPSFDKYLPGRHRLGVGASLSMIEENLTQERVEEEDHYLEFEEVVSTFSNDTRSSPKRILQMSNN